MRKLIQSIGRWLNPSGLFFGKRTDRIRHACGSAAPPETLGLAGERLAASYLRKLGYKLIAHGHRQKLGEIDLIAIDDGCVVFVEVKTWVSDRQADPSMAVDSIKQKKISRTALIYLKRHRLLDQRARFDVVSIVWNGSSESEPRIRHFKHAFEAIGI